MGYGTVGSTGTRFNWYAATLDDLQRFQVQLPASGCSARASTTSTADALGCVVATNAGYFQFAAKPTFCLGEVIVNSKVRAQRKDEQGEVESWCGDVQVTVYR